MKININIERLAKLEQAFLKLPDIVKKNLRLATRASMSTVAEEARHTHRFTSRSGMLERSIRERFVSDWPPVGRVELDEGVAKHAPFIHSGTGLYGPKHKMLKPIKPVNKKALRWAGPNGFIFARSTKPRAGIRPDEFLYEAAENKREAVNAIFNRYVDRAINEVRLNG